MLSTIVHSGVIKRGKPTKWAYMGIEVFSSARLDCMQCQEFSQRHNPSYQGWSQQHRNLGPVATFQNSFLVLEDVGTNQLIPSRSDTSLIIPNRSKAKNGGKPIIKPPPSHHHKSLGFKMIQTIPSPGWFMILFYHVLPTYSALFGAQTAGRRC